MSAAAPCCSSRRAVLIVLVLATASTASGPPATQQSRPNVLFICVDDMRMDLGSTAATPAVTPSLDELAERGMLFQRAYCQQAVCNPSRASLLTGRRPDTLRVWDLSTHFRDTHPDVRTLPQWFRDHGYFTQCVGKVFHNWRTEIHGDPDSWSVEAQLHWGTHGSDWVVPQGRTPSEGKPEAMQSLDVPDAAYRDGRVTEAAIEALQTLAKRPDPFFLAVGFWKPHLPFNAPERYWEAYDRDAMTFLPGAMQPPNGVPELALHDWRELRGYGGVPRTGPLSPELEAELRHGYLAAVSFADAQVGLLLEQLEQLGLADNTIVVFWSDHGVHLGEHGLWCKTSNFELDARVPLLLAGPGVPQGRSTEALVELLDLYPTLLALCALPAAPGLEGVSLMPLLENPRAEVRAGAFTQHPRPPYYRDQPEVMGYSVRTTDLRYTEWRDFENGSILAREAYDHRSDPGETDNVLDELEGTPVLAQAVALLRAQVPLPDGTGANEETGEEKDGRATQEERRHEQRVIEGWTVFVDRQLLEEGAASEVGEAALDLLANKLDDLKQVLPAERVLEMQDVSIYLDHRHPLGGMQYHPSADWLRDHGHDTAMARCVHIPNAERFVNLCRSNEQPWVILHELAHAWHDQVIGFDDRRVRKAFRRARDAGLYNETLHIRGEMTRHYALTDEKEFFAELTEAYFGTNDFFPFVKAELQRHDPETFRLLESIWSP